MFNSYAKFLVAALVLSACRSQSVAVPVDAVPPVPVSVVPVQVGNMSQPVIATGTFGSRDEIPLSFKIGGVISSVLVDEGNAVAKGQVLASLDLREIDTAVEKARVAVEKAERDAERVKRLAADSVATPVQAQDAMSAYLAARADYAAARVNREYATIRAPESGVVLRRHMSAGVTIGVGLPVLTLGGGARGRVLRVGLPDRDALRVHVGAQVAVHFDALPEIEFVGHVTLTGRSADQRNGTYAVEIALSNADALPAGLVGRAAIAVEAATMGMFVPVDALLEADADSAIVYTVGAHAPFTAEAHRVRIVQLLGQNAEVSGLVAGARVITRGAPYVSAGSRVRIVAPEMVATNGRDQ